MGDRSGTAASVNADIVRRALRASVNGDQSLPAYIGNALAALDTLVEQVTEADVRADLAEQRMIGHAAYCHRTTPMPPMPPDPVIARGPDGIDTVTWPDGRPEWCAVASDLVEAWVQQMNAYRAAERARRGSAWWAPWRWVRRG